MPSEKRQRQDTGRMARLEEQRAADRRRQRTRQLRALGLLLGGIIVVALLISVFSGGDDDDTDGATDGSTTTEAPDDTTDDTTYDTSEDGSTTGTTAGEAVEIVLPGEGESITGETPCPPADGSAERTTAFESAPPTCIEDGKTYTATLATTEGEIVIELDAEAAPETVNNFVVLSRYHFYDGVPSRKSTRLNPVTNAHLVCRLLLEKKKNTTHQ